MARTARVASSTGVYAVTLRTHKPLFSDKEQREILKECIDRYVGGGLMGLKFSNSMAELLVKETERGISADMKSIKTSFSRMSNNVNEGSGSVFCDRFRSVPVEDEETEKKCLEYLGGASDDAGVFYIRGVHSAQKSDGQKKKKTKVSKTIPKTEKSKTSEKPENPKEEKMTEKTEEAKRESIPEKTEELQKPAVKKRRNDMPTWLL